MIVMGIGRFAYTPILPYLQDAVRLTDVMAGYLASANYLGYLLGAFLAGISQWKKGKTFYLRFYLVINILTTIAMGLTDLYLLWFFFRFISGLTSGLVFVLASSIILDILALTKQSLWSGMFYSGVGMGIFITGLIVPVLEHYFSWRGAWSGLGILSIFIGVFTFLWLKENSSDKIKYPSSIMPCPKASHKQRILPWLIASYGCEGMGYSVSGTFLVALVQDIPSLSHIPSLSWVFVGIAAIPSCMLWAWVAKKYSNLIALQIAFFTQIVGVILPVIFFNFYGALIGALLFGATFMGITTLAVSEGRRIAPHQSSKVIGYLTCVYGIGQMIGPSIAGILIAKSGNYHSSLLFAASVLVFGMLFLGIVQIKNKKLERMKNNALCKH
ncbi:putative MFS family arabinose efflux permease [Anoxybacillus vitaminiphilus]|uniref:Putative MFS family arabinose efflux permease n=1 Tax=Paranoxybacillus vitaminiphilus TaxID=581036 RepID=A0A327YAM7_9BACL|nr:YbfB/YjiJ family MFS transporter [Anoxybacillus vitaminiphilus]RAK17172.1 putative MFS family arabinose efflux permease [Anoxybacillus vitaminiphilus]